MANAGPGYVARWEGNYRNNKHYSLLASHTDWPYSSSIYLLPRSSSRNSCVAVGQKGGQAGRLKCCPRKLFFFSIRILACPLLLSLLFRSTLITSNAAGASSSPSVPRTVCRPATTASSCHRRRSCSTPCCCFCRLHTPDSAVVYAAVLPFSPLCLM